MAKVQVVTAYVPLKVQNMNEEQFHALGTRLCNAAIDGGASVKCFDDFPFEDCWLAQENPPHKCANPRATDRFATDEEQWRSNIIQHSPMQWVSLAAAADPEPEVFVWLGYSLLKQGDFTGKRITEKHVTDFVRRLEGLNLQTIPVPGISERLPVNDLGDNWRFCGSTIIVPRKFLMGIAKSYFFECRRFIRRVKAVPLDLAIWPSVEANSGLPWQWYKAEYDYTQLTNLPC